MEVLSASANALAGAIGAVERFQRGWAAGEPFASALYRFQVDLFTLAGRTDEVLASAGGVFDPAAGWSLPEGSPLTPLLEPRNAIVGFEAIGVPAMVGAGDRDAAAAALTADGCGPVGGFAAAIDAVVTGGGG